MELDASAHEALAALAERAGFVASRAFARYWHAEALKVAEAIDDPETRWAILTEALRRVGYGEVGGG